MAVARMISENLQDEHKIIVVKSTVPVGTCDLVRSIIAEHSDNVTALCLRIPTFA